MRVDLLAGTIYTPMVVPAPVPTILVFDSGLGGLTVFAEVLKARPDARFVYAADDAGCRVALVGSRRFAAFAEAELSGAPVPDADIAEELRPCFIEDAGGRTDVV